MINKNQAIITGLILCGLSAITKSEPLLTTGLVMFNIGFAVK